MNKTFIFILLIVIVYINGFEIEKIEKKIFNLVNVERKKINIDSLKYDEKLANVARIHSENMATKNFFSHTGIDGTSPADRKNRYYPELIGGIGENIAYLYNSNNTEDEIAIFFMDIWMNSPPHRENILNKNYNIIGVGIYKKNNILYGTQNFCIGNAIFISDNNVKQKEELFPIKVKYRETKRFKFKFIGNYPKDKITIFVFFPDKQAKFWVGKYYYTGSGPCEPIWLDEENFEIEITFDKGIGIYNLYMGSYGKYYKDCKFTFLAGEEE